jgi:hypothetical protein
MGGLGIRTALRKLQPIPRDLRCRWHRCWLVIALVRTWVSVNRLQVSSTLRDAAEAARLEGALELILLRPPQLAGDIGVRYIGTADRETVPQSGAITRLQRRLPCL